MGTVPSVYPLGFPGVNEENRPLPLKLSQERRAGTVVAQKFPGNLCATDPPGDPTEAHVAQKLPGNFCARRCPQAMATAGRITLF